RIYKSLFSNQYDWDIISPTYVGSPFRFAPPIWIEQTFKLCGDGSVSPIDDGIAMSSYMPDLYLYVDGKNVDIDGVEQSYTSPSEDANRVLAGEFDALSRDPLFGSSDGPWSGCPVRVDWPRAGNPWNMNIMEREDKGDDVRLCSTGENFSH